MKTTWADDVRTMHDKFGVREAVDRMDRETLGRFLEFRTRFLREELSELESASTPGDRVDALVDLCVVAIGTLDALRVDPQEAWDRVFRANLGKEVGVKAGRPNPLGLPDLVKPVGWSPPDHFGNLGRFSDLPSGPTVSAWDRRYYLLADHVAGWSKDPSTKVGAVLVGVDRRDIAVGYNGFPPGIIDDERLDDRPTKYRLIQHAERNVLDNARFSTRGSTLYTTSFPCSECSKSIVSRGIGRVISPPPTDREPWRSDVEWSRSIFDEAGVEVSEV